RDLQPSIDRRIDHRKVALAPQSIEEDPQVGKGGLAHGFGECSRARALLAAAADSPRPRPDSVDCHTVRAGPDRPQAPGEGGEAIRDLLASRFQGASEK